MFYLLAALAVYRISRMIVLEEGPFGAFAWLQEKTKKQDNWIERGLACPLCISFWLSLVAALFFLPAPFPEFLLTWFGIAGGAVVFYQRVH